MQIWLVAVAATALCVDPLGAQEAAPPASMAQQFEAAVTLLDSRGDCAAAVPAFERIASSPDRALAARALVYLGSCYERLGNEKARQVYRRVIEQYSDQRSAAIQARERLAALERTTRGAEGLTLRPLWNSRPTHELAGRPTVDGHTFPMLDDDGNLVISDLDLRGQRPPVALGAASDSLPSCITEDRVVLSPDGHQAAFACEAVKGRSELRVIRLDLTPPRQRRVLDETVEPLHWRSGNALLVQRRSGATPDLAFVNTDTGAVRPVAALAAPVSSASISPDGAWVAFDAPDVTGVGRHDIMIAPSTGGAPVAITSGPSDNLLPGWTPNGRGVLFVSDRTGSPGLWVQDVIRGRGGAAPQLLTQDLGRVMDVWAATPAGEFVYFRQTGLVKVGIAALNPDGSAGKPSIAVTRQWGGTMMPGWSPDGTRLAYQTTLTGTRSLALGIKDLRTGEERMVATSLWFVMPRFSPDGRSVAVTGRDQEGRYGLFLIDSASGQASALKLMPRMEEDRLGAYRWGTDGSLLVIVGRTCERLDVQTLQSTALWTVSDGFVSRFAIQRQTGALAFVQHVKGVTTLNVRDSNGTSREVRRADPDETFYDVEWTPDGSAILFTRIPTARNLTGQARWPSLWRIDVKTLATQAMGLSMEGLRDVVVSPDGTQLAFTTGFPTREPWILEHYLPATYLVPARR